jgi:hypothetical protein
MLGGLFEGLNASLLAYGQTGSGTLNFKMSETVTIQILIQFQNRIQNEPIQI